MQQGHASSYSDCDIGQSGLAPLASAGELPTPDGLWKRRSATVADTLYISVRILEWACKIGDVFWEARFANGMICAVTQQLPCFA